MAILLISHDLDMVAEMADRVLVMYTGKIVEEAPTAELMAAPKHPYTQGLLAAIPRLGAGTDEPLEGIPGAVPNLLDLPSGCTFHPRCDLADEACAAEIPRLERVGPHRQCACFKTEGA